MAIKIEGSSSGFRLIMAVVSLLFAAAVVYFVTEGALWWPRRGSGSNWIYQSIAPAYFWAGVLADVFIAMTCGWIALRGSQPMPDENYVKAWEIRKHLAGSALLAVALAVLAAKGFVTGEVGLPRLFGVARLDTNPVWFAILAGFFSLLSLGFFYMTYSHWRELKALPGKTTKK